jgi:hypothetical protein
MVGRKAIPDARRAALVRDHRLVTMLTADEKDRLNKAAEELGYISAADLVREAIMKFLDAKEKRR